MMYSWLQLTKNWAVVCKTSIRYICTIRLLPNYLKPAAKRQSMCINFHQDSSKTGRQDFIAAYRQIDSSGDAD